MKSLKDYILKAQISVEQRRLYVGQFIDDFKRTKNMSLIEKPIIENDPISKLFEAIAHQLCIDLNLDIPDWLNNPVCLDDPFFVSDLPNSRFLALRDSPIAFKSRNIFVPYNYLSRA